MKYLRLFLLRQSAYYCFFLVFALWGCEESPVAQKDEKEDKKLPTIIEFFYPSITVESTATEAISTLIVKKNGDILSGEALDRIKEEFIFSNPEVSTDSTGYTAKYSAYFDEKKNLIFERGPAAGTSGEWHNAHFHISPKDPLTYSLKGSTEKKVVITVQ